MGEFEVLERDGLARIGRLSTPHGPIETPALLPVIQPDPTRQPVVPREIRRRFGLKAVITSSYITYRGPDLRERALAKGIHGLIDFDGPIMTDSGAFQQHAYGHVEVTPEEILSFQAAIGSDIATVLDVFVEPDADHETAAAGVRQTIERARAARQERTGLLAVPVQGGSYADLRAESARSASELGDVLAVGGVVPLLEQYRYAELAQAVLAARADLSPAGVVHLFGTGHPMVFAFGAVLGVDLYDSSAYHKFARRDRLLFPDGTVALEDVREELCHCALCAERPLYSLGREPPTERERWIAAHNLLISAEEMGRVRQAIREGTLWELAERRSTAHPALAAGLRLLKGRSEVFLPTEPESRRTYRETGIASFDRPAAVRFRRALERYRAGRPSGTTIRRLPLEPEYLSRLPLSDARGGVIQWECESPFGPVPLELIELYPVGPCLSEEEFRLPRPSRLSVREIGEDAGARAGLPPGPRSEFLAAWDRLQLRASLEWRYGEAVAETILTGGAQAERSRRTGRLRAIVRDGRTLFQVLNDGIPRPTFAGAELLHALVEAPGERVCVAADAAPFVREGRSLFSRFVLSADPRLVPGSSALLVGPGDELLAVGRLLLAPHEMGRLRRGVAVFVSAHARQPLPPNEEPADEP
ncbi:MAG: tRNA guanosine(15) transglycosylase TgtA [Thermoplasmata archaeon]